MREILNDVDRLSDKNNSLRHSQKLLCQSLPKRFYEKVDVICKEENFSILLDGHPLKTPAKRDFFIPVKKLAVLVAQEFTMQKEVIDPAKMPITRLVNTVIDGIIDNMQIIFEDLLRFVACDMIFYRAQTPKELVERQSEKWNFLLDWAEEKLGARFNLAEGLMHIEQPPESIQAVSNYLRKIESPYVLAAFYSMTTLTGSALITFAVAEKKISPDDAWTIAHLDEDWTMEHWGKDEETVTRRAHKKVEFDAAATVIAMKFSSFYV
ncbi:MULTISPECIES: ATP12 family chaperone protein [unclassified Bartonella]|uniref:ATP12 family chaperone protein n=1 Tax=unclassified Bartonella TaxID=2645622 RepID=UPI000998FB4C|nr:MULTISPECIES: ATP12 family protein [unclassified Bartonella]AQX28154.1 Chaperone required for the assembly of the F1-ATPase [Bartonella sp. JB15]AQX29425.1 Chaperone required for the assembly of the F1-ATPase [Bartonella sp. JB63]